MELLRTLALSLCGSAVIGSVLHLLCPAGAMRKVYKTALAAFFLCCTVLPISKADLSDIPYYLESALSGFGYRDGEDLQMALTKQVVAQFELTMRRMLERELLALAVIPKEITVHAHASENGCIEWEQITVLLDASYRKMDADVKVRIERMAGVMPEVVYA